MVGTVAACTSSVLAVLAGMVTTPGYVFQKREAARSKLVWSLAVYGGGTTGCQRPPKKVFFDVYFDNSSVQSRKFLRCFTSLSNTAPSRVHESE